MADLAGPRTGTLGEADAAWVEADALARDAADPLSSFRDRFLLPVGEDGTPAIYLAGQSLGLQPRSARAAIEAELDAWARLGIDAHFTPVVRGSPSRRRSASRWPGSSARARQRSRFSTG